MRAGAIAALCAALCGCGYVGDPLPPSLDIPQAVTNLRALEYGEDVLVEFTVPEQSTEGLVLKSLRSVDLYVAPTGSTTIEQWVAQSRKYPLAASKTGATEFKFPATDWADRDIELRVRAVGPKGRDSAWSNLVALRVLRPLIRPSELRLQSVREGVALSWKGAGPGYRIYRASADGKPAPLADTPETSFTDQTTVYGITYRYQVQALASDLQQSLMLEPVSVTPEDTFAPEVPAGLSGLAAGASIELAWQPNTEEDFANYTLYRAIDDGEFQPLATGLTSPAYSDRQIENGKRYRYALSAADAKGNRSATSAPIQVVAQ